MGVCWWEYQGKRDPQPPQALPEESQVYTTEYMHQWRESSRARRMGERMSGFRLCCADGFVPGTCLALASEPDVFLQVDQVPEHERRGLQTEGRKVRTRVNEEESDHAGRQVRLQKTASFQQARSKAPAPWCN